MHRKLGTVMLTGRYDHSNTIRELRTMVQIRKSKWKYSSDLRFGTQVLLKCRRNVCEDSQKEYVLSLLRERVDIAWYTV